MKILQQTDRIPNSHTDFGSTRGCNCTEERQRANVLQNGQSESRCIFRGHKKDQQHRGAFVLSRVHLIASDYYHRKSVWQPVRHGPEILNSVFASIHGSDSQWKARTHSQASGALHYKRSVHQQRVRSFEHAPHSRGLGGATNKPPAQLTCSNRRQFGAKCVRVVVHPGSFYSRVNLQDSL